MRRMGAAGHIVAEERLVRRDRVELIQPGDGSGGHCGGQVPARLADIGMVLGPVGQERQRPMPPATE